MQQGTSQCTNCGAFVRRSLHHEEEYQSSVLLKRLRTSNLPATDEEISHIRRTILPTVSNDILSIESNVAALHAVIRLMEEERERLIKVQTQYSNLVSLHRTLPSEILSKIFLFTIPDARNSYTSDCNAFNASGSMWLLSHVCQRWRNVVLSLRSFWSTINLRFPQAAEAEGGVQRLDAVLQRSRHGPLDVSLESHRRSDPSILKRFLDTIMEESYRWRVLRLSDDAGCFNMLYAQLHNRVPQLQSLSLHNVQIKPEEQSVFKVCPCLTSLSLGGKSLPVVDFPWDQIMELDLSDMDSDGGEDDLRACMRLTGLCTSLQTLSTRLWYFEDRGAASPYPPTTCSTVRRLETQSAHLIDALTLPCLREADFHPSPAARHENALYSFKQLLIRSNCMSGLTRLSLSGMSLGGASQTLHSILYFTNNLTFLDLLVHMQDFDDETDASDHEQIIMLVKSLEVEPTRTTKFLPLLSSLNIRIYDHPWNSGTAITKYFNPVRDFASTIQARWKGDDTIGLARLRTFHYGVQAEHLIPSIYWDAGTPVARIFGKAQNLIFAELVDEGMDLAIRVTSNLAANGGGNNAVFANRSY